MWPSFQFKFSRFHLELSDVITIQKICYFSRTFETIKVLYPKQYRTISEAWKTNLFCDSCFENSTEMLAPVRVSCIFQVSCRCNICLRQPPSLRSLASHAVFHVRYNIGQFELTVETVCNNYKYETNSQKVSLHKLVPFTFSTLHCNYVNIDIFQTKNFITIVYSKVNAFL